MKVSTARSAHFSTADIMWLPFTGSGDPGARPWRRTHTCDPSPGGADAGRAVGGEEGPLPLTVGAGEGDTIGSTPKKKEKTKKSPKGLGCTRPDDSACPAMRAAQRYKNGFWRPQGHGWAPCNPLRLGLRARRRGHRERRGAAAARAGRESSELPGGRSPPHRRPRKARSGRPGRPRLLAAPSRVAAAPAGRGPAGGIQEAGKTQWRRDHHFGLPPSPPLPRSPCSPPRLALRKGPRPRDRAPDRAPAARTPPGRGVSGARAAGRGGARADGGGWRARPKLT